MATATQDELDAIQAGIIKFACWLELEHRQEMRRKGYPVDRELGEYTSRIVPGRKYTKVDIGKSGFYMVANDTGEIYGIKSYGVINRKKRYGTVETLAEWDWGGFEAVRRIVDKPA